jgi:hypothetical protein
MYGDSIDTRKSQYEDLEELDFISYIFITLSKVDSDFFIPISCLQKLFF